MNSYLTTILKSTSQCKLPDTFMWNLQFVIRGFKRSAVTIRLIVFTVQGQIHLRSRSRYQMSMSRYSQCRPHYLSIKMPQFVNLNKLNYCHYMNRSAATSVKMLLLISLLLSLVVSLLLLLLLLLLLSLLLFGGTTKSRRQRLYYE